MHKAEPYATAIYCNVVPTAKTKSPYSVSPRVAMTQKWVSTLKEKTGRPLEEWIRLVEKDGPSGEKERRAWLKSKYGLGTPTATSIAERAHGTGWEMDDPDAYLRAAEQYVEVMFVGRRAAQPIYDALLNLALGLDKEVKACPCKTIVPLYRKHVFAQLKPASWNRIDLGFALGARPAEGRLISTGGYAKKDRITHRIPISSLAEIDNEVKQWLRIAFEEDR